MAKPGYFASTYLSRTEMIEPLKNAKELIQSSDKLITSSYLVPHFSGREYIKFPRESEDISQLLKTYDTILFKELDGFDEKLIRNQDYELNIRIRAKGRLVWFTPDLVVKYFPRSNISQLFSQFFQYGSWKRKVIFKHPKSLKARQLAPPTLIVMLLSSAILFALSSAWYLVPSLGYFFLCIAVSTVQKGISLRVKATLSLAFITMHVAWGLGFLFGRAKITEFCSE